jgi:hypothetical protein
MAIVGLSPEATAVMVLRALEARYRRARSWAPASVLATELRLEAAEVGRALARLVVEDRVERRVDWDRDGLDAQWRRRPDAARAEAGEAAG